MTGTNVSPLATVVSFLMLLLALAIPVGLVLVIVGLVQYFRPVPQSPNPEDTLRQRYAAGEISLSEYEEMLRTLRGEQP